MGKIKIDALVAELIEFPKFVGIILKVSREQDKSQDNFNACWVLDHLLRKRLNYLLPFINEFIEQLAHITWETTMRPYARILESLNLSYFEKKDAALIEAITAAHQEVMAEVCFDWLIGKHKVATKVFAMTSLYYLGEKFDWVRPELKSVVESQMGNGSAGFKSRGGKILKTLNNLGY
ncbi:MAG: hypothetical protein AAGA86_15490 [Bacteroidota bacterium]